MYKIEHAYNILLIKVVGEVFLGVSTMYAITVGKVEANEKKRKKKLQWLAYSPEAMS